MCCQGGDKLTLSLQGASNLLVDLEPEATAPPSSLELLAAHLPPPLTAVPAPAAGLPVSVTHFSLNGLAGVQRETLFSDVFTASSNNSTTASLETTGPVFNTSPSSTTSSFNANNPFINNNINIINNNNANNNNNNSNNDASSSNGGLSNGNSSGGGGQKFATIGRSNPFTSPNRSKNPFLDRLEGNGDCPVGATNGGPGPGSPMSTSPATSPEASLDPVSDSGSSTTLNKIVSIFCVVFCVSVLCVRLNIFDYYY